MRRSSFGQALYELLSSMRFAISLLVIIAIAAIVGTELLQNQPYQDYIFQFGEFWFKPFEAIGLFDVYHASWFLCMLAFLVGSTSLCIYRHFPGVMRDIRLYREQAALKSLRAVGHHLEVDTALGADALAPQTEHWLAMHGYRFKRVPREDGLMIAAKKGSLQRLGYLFAHAAIVVICVGGLMDGNVPLKVQQWLGNKAVETTNLPASKIPAQSRLSTSNLSFRANVDLPEGMSSDVAFQNAGRGYFVQELPFAIKLKQFHIEHYSTGQPKLFASDIEVTDKATGKVTNGTVQVNHPLIVDGIAIYQSSFGDGGSPVAFTAWDMTGTHPDSMPLSAVSLNSFPADWHGQKLTLEFEEFRPFNIENVGEAGMPDQAGLGKRMEDAREVKAHKRVKNMGPSIQFRVRDAQGQAHEYLNYLAPFEEDGRFYLLTGMRTELAAPFGYMRIPLDDDLKPDTFMRLRATLRDPQAWPEIAHRTAEKVKAAGNLSEGVQKEFEQTLVAVLQRFADGGFIALDRFLLSKVPADKRQAVGETYVKFLQSSVVDAMDVAQLRARLQPIALDEKHYRFLLDSLAAVSDSYGYGSDYYLQPVSFSEVKSSGFQVTRSPGQPLVYLGSILLVLGIFCMFYIRENRVWIWLGNGKLLLSFTSNRRDDITDREFESYRHGIMALAGTAEGAAT
ncbi:MAG: cytochrome c biogenesis protein ResB [Burkholderiales bacterium]|nr:cytochrome c biogenesis protein ResB [Burkholderiales bacterium]